MDQNALATLAALARALESAEGTAPPNVTKVRGVLSIGPNPEILSDFCRAVFEGDWMIPQFDWPAWAATAEAEALRERRDALAMAKPEQIARLLTALIRRDRFVEGSLISDLASGLLTAIARRAQSLLDEMPPP